MKYHYKARNSKGDPSSGIIESSSPEFVVEMLHRHNLIVTDLGEAEKVPLYSKKIKIFPERIKTKELVFLFKQLSSLFSANVPLIEALTAVSKQTSNDFLRQVLLDIASDVDGGMAFSEALSHHSKTFSPFIVNLIRTGEAVGNLGRVLEHLSNHIERNYNLTAKIKGAMYYPAFIIVAIVLVVIIMLVFVLPQMSGMFEDFGVELPLPTKILMILSNFLINYGWTLIIILSFLFVLVWRYLKTSSGQRIKSIVEIKFPVTGSLFQKIYLSRLAENLSTLMKGGLSIVRSLEIVAEVVGNTLYRDVLKEAQDTVRRGETIFSAFDKSEIIPPTFSQMISSGEKSGKIQDVLLDLAKFYSTEVNTTVNNLMSLLEPLLIALMAVMVGFVAAAVLLPVYQLAGSI